MADQAQQSVAPGSRSVLDPLDRLSEIMFGLLMTLTFTGTMSASLREGDTVQSVLHAALACSIAWGFIDAVMYVLTAGVDRGRRRAALIALREATPEEAQRMVATLLPGELDPPLRPAEIDRFTAWLKTEKIPAETLVQPDDFSGAWRVFGLVVLATLPPCIPFLIFSNVPVAMRMSNTVAVVMLFAIGWALGRLMGRSPWPVGLVVAALGVVLVAITIALGG
jgi:VIT family